MAWVDGYVTPSQPQTGQSPEEQNPQRDFARQKPLLRHRSCTRSELQYSPGSQSTSEAHGRELFGSKVDSGRGQAVAASSLPKQSPVV
jgi:hypothetical protein